MNIQLSDLPAGTVIEVMEPGGPERYELTADWRRVDYEEDVVKVDDMARRHPKFKIISVPFEMLVIFSQWLVESDGGCLEEQIELATLKLRQFKDAKHDAN